MQKQHIRLRGCTTELSEGSDPESLGNINCLCMMFRTASLWNKIVQQTQAAFISSMGGFLLWK